MHHALIRHHHRPAGAAGALRESSLSTEAGAAAFQHAPTALATLDDEHRLATVNRAWCALLGGEPSWWRGRSWLDTAAGSDALAELAGLEGLRRGEPGPVRGRRDLRGAADARIAADIVIAPLPQGGAVAAAQAVDHAVAAPAAGAELEGLAAALSHDLRQEARMVASYAGLVLHRLGPRLAGSEAEQLASIAEHALRMQRRLALVALALRLQLVRPARTDCSRAWTAALALMANGQRLPAAVPAVPRRDLPLVMGDPERLPEVMAELLRSARQRGAPQPECTAQPEGGAWRLSFPGAAGSADHRQFRLFAAATPGDDAAGPALALALAQACGGRAWLETVVGQGATLHLVLPAAG